MSTNTYVSVHPRAADDVVVRCHRPNTEIDPTTTIVAICVGAVTIQFPTRADACAWVAHMAAAVDTAIRNANFQDQFDQVADEVVVS